MTQPEELWKPIVGYEGVYAVSNLGRVKREAGSWRTPEDVIKDIIVTKYGYCVARLKHKGIQRTVFVHRLVARAFF